MKCLPHHILVEIFTNLDSSSLIVACKVCQLWSDLIKSSPSIMKIFNLKITSNRSRQTITIHDQLPCGRHQNLEIIDFCGDTIILQQLLSMHRMSISSVKITRPAQWHAQMFTEAFGALRNLRHLTLENCQLSECSESIGCLERLKSLRVVNCNCEIFSIFAGGQCGNLSSLAVEYSQIFNKQNELTMKYLTNLMSKLVNLQHLSLIGVISLKNNPFSDNFEHKFYLKRLIIDELDTNVINFLKNQKESLRYLRVFKKPCNEIIGIIKDEMKLNKFEF